MLKSMFREFLVMDFSVFVRCLISQHDQGFVTYFKNVCRVFVLIIMCNCLFCKDGKIYLFTGVLLQMVLWFILQTERLTRLLVCRCRWYCGL